MFTLDLNTLVNNFFDIIQFGEKTQTKRLVMRPAAKMLSVDTITMTHLQV